MARLGRLTAIAVVLAAFLCNAARAEQEPEALLRIVELPKLSGVPLKNVINNIAAQSGIRVAYDSELNDSVLDAPIHASLPTISAGQAIELILKPQQLRCEVVGHTVLITTGIDDRAWKTVTYSVADLAVPPGAEPRTKPDFESLCDLIEGTVADWYDPDAPGEIRVDSQQRQLVVSHTIQTHREIANLLEQLRVLRRKHAAKHYLETKVNLQLERKPLAEVLNEISFQCHVNFLLAPECGNPVVSINVQDLTGASALKQLLAPLGFGQKFGNEAVTITKSDELYTVMYPMGDLVAADRKAPQVAMLIDTIKAGVLPESWRRSASIEHFDTNQSLVVCQTEQGHDAVRAMLTALREGAGR